MKLVEDFKAFVNGKGIKKGIATLVLNPCFHCVLLFRLASFLYKIHLGIVSKIIWYFNRIIYNVDIDYRANLAGGFVLVHGLGVVIGKSVTSKGRLMVYQGVTIGGNQGRTRELEDGKVIGQPIIGENVIIYSNASLFGPLIVSDNAIVKAGQIVTKDL